MTDILDRASELEELQREVALASARYRPAGQSYSHCEECGDDIPEARRKAVPGCHRCIHCQQRYEQRGAA